jgi:hypothetical protein
MLNTCRIVSRAILIDGLLLAFYLRPEVLRRMNATFGPELPKSPELPKLSIEPRPFRFRAITCDDGDLARFLITAV